jgi:hypothetical protein
MFAELVVYSRTIMTQRGTMTDWPQAMHEWRQEECSNLDSTFLNTSKILIDQRSKLRSFNQDLWALTALYINSLLRYGAVLFSTYVPTFRTTPMLLSWVGSCSLSKNMAVHIYQIKRCHILLDCKAVPLQAWTGPEGSRKLRLPDFVTMAQDGGKVVSPKHRPPLPQGNTPGTHFC